VLVEQQDGHLATQGSGHAVIAELENPIRGQGVRRGSFPDIDAQPEALDSLGY